MEVADAVGAVTGRWQPVGQGGKIRSWHCTALLRMYDDERVSSMVAVLFNVFAALAEFIRELIIEGTNEGLAAARARGVRLGRPPAMTPQQIQTARTLLSQPEHTVSSIARLLGVSRSTIYKYVPELTTQPTAPLAGEPEAPTLVLADSVSERPIPARPGPVRARPAAIARRTSTSCSCTAKPSKPSGSRSTQTSTSWLSAGTANIANPTGPRS